MPNLASSHSFTMESNMTNVLLQMQLRELCGALPKLIQMELLLKVAGEIAQKDVLEQV
jgi:hypothetical protein